MYFKLSNPLSYFADLDNAVSISGEQVVNWNPSNYTERGLKGGVLVEATKEEYEAYVLGNVTKDDYQTFVTAKKERELVQLKEKEKEEYLLWQEEQKKRGAV